MTVGNEPDYFASLAEFESIVERKSPKGFEFTYVKMENENHGSVPHLSIYSGLESIFTGWKLPKETFTGGLAKVDDHYNMLSQKYGYEIETPEYTVNALGYYFLNQKNRITAIRVFQENTKRFPQSANVYDSLGEAFENDDQFAEAEVNYNKAVEIAKKQAHPNLIIYEKNLERVKGTN
jgi:tetratricopeptide (TPR) repeat protein